MKSIVSLIILASISIAVAQENSTIKSIESAVDSMNQGSYGASIEILTKAHTLALKNGNYRDAYLSENNIGLNYFLLNDFAEAMKHYGNAYGMATDYLEERDQIIVLNNIAVLYAKRDEYDQSETYLKKVYKIASEQNDIYRQVASSINLAQMSLAQDHVLKAERYLNQIEFLQPDNEVLELNISLINAKISFKHSDLAEAKSIATSVLYDIELYPEKYKDEHTSVIILLAKIAISEQKYSEALGYLESKEIPHLNLEQELLVLNEKLEVFKLIQDFDKVISIQDAIIEKQIELKTSERATLFEANKIKFEINSFKQELLRQSKENERQLELIFLLSVFSGIAIILFAWALYNSKMSSKRGKLLMKQREEIHRLELEKSEMEFNEAKHQFLENEKQLAKRQNGLSEKIESSNRKLSTMALNANGKNDLIKKLVCELEILLKKSNFQKEVKNTIDELKRLMDSEKNWVSFTHHFEKVKPEFLTKLKERHPGLTSNDIRFLSYLYMNVSLKEIALIFGITPETCRKRKERIAQKLELKSSSQLFDYLCCI